MATKPGLALKHLSPPLFLLLIVFPLLFFFSSSLPWGGDDATSWKAPLRAMDLLPLLPRRVAWPLLRSLRSAVDLLPTFVGSASSPDADLEWKGACFYKSTAWMEFHNKSKSQFGGGTLHIKISNAHSWTCMDLYVFATPYRVTWDYYLLSREHTLDFHMWEGEAEYEYVKNHGVSIFLMESGMIGTLQALWDVFPLFKILDGVKVQILLSLRSIWELHLSNDLNHGFQLSMLMIFTQETSWLSQKFVGVGVDLKL